MCVYDKLNELGVELPKMPPKAGVFVFVKEFGHKLAYVSGCGPDINGELFKKGKLGQEITLEEGQEAARNCAVNMLTLIHNHVGDLNKVKNIVKVLGFVASSDTFFEQPKVINGCSEFLENLFGSEIGLGARSAIGTNVLPGNIPVEIELLFELK
ncbi:MAG: RidA family protein [Oscillospiraceae bacterium]|nr:RidA family protein [Oscillospiraceae bacterium]